MNNEIKHLGGGDFEVVPEKQDRLLGHDDLKEAAKTGYMHGFSVAQALVLNDTLLQQFQNKQGEWSDATFGNQVGNPQSKLAHLAKELVELREEPFDVDEYADCFMLLLDAARVAGFNTHDVLLAAFAKLEVNKEREWGEPDEDGAVEHIRG